LLLHKDAQARAEAAIAASERLLNATGDARSAIRAINRVSVADIAARRLQYDAAAAGYAGVLRDWPPTLGEMPEPYLAASIGQVDVDLARQSASAALTEARNLQSRIMALPDQQYRGDAQARALVALGSALLAAGEGPAARDALRRAVAQRADLDAPDSAPLAFARALLAEALRRDHDATQAIALDVQAAPVLARYPTLRATLGSIVPQGRQLAGMRPAPSIRKGGL
jgi:hypothetical protein